MKKLIQVLFLLLLSILLTGVVILRIQQPQTPVAGTTQSGVAETVGSPAAATNSDSSSDIAGTGISVPVVSAPEVPVVTTPEPTPTPTPTPEPTPDPVETETPEDGGNR